MKISAKNISKKENDLKIATRNIRKLLVKISSSSTKVYYKGHIIETVTDKENDNIKRSFFVSLPDGNQIILNVNPYERTNITAMLWIDAAIESKIYPPPSDPNKNPWTVESIKHYTQTQSKDYQKLYEDTFGPQKNSKIISNIINHIKKFAQNNVNMGTDINQGIPAASNLPTTQQEEQMQSDFLADLDASKNMNPMQQWKKSLSPEKKILLPKDITKLQSIFPGLKGLLSNPNIKLTTQAVLDFMSKSDPSKIQQVQKILKQLQDVNQQEEQMALSRPYIIPNNIPQQQVSNVNNLNKGNQGSR